jgi:flagellar hook-associated protein 2
MTGIKAAGSGSGLDIASLVSQLVAAERQPLDARISRSRFAASAEISALGSLKSGISTLHDALAGMRTASAFAARTVVSSDPASLTATATSAVEPGSYEVEVVNLAAAHRLASGPFVAGSTAPVGTGTLSITSGDVSFSVTLDETHNTLADIRTAINAAAGNTGVSASILNEAGGSRLILTARNSGLDNAITIGQTGGDGGLAQLVYDAANPGANTLTETTPAVDAKVRINGYLFESASNVVTGAIEGLTITLKKAAENTKHTLTIANDVAGVTARIKKFVADYNALAKSFSALQAYDAATGKAGAMIGDAFVQALDSQVRRDTTGAVAGLIGTYTSLAAIGIKTDATGQLTVDDAKLAAALATDYGGVTQLFTSSGGIANRLYDRLHDALDNAATLKTRNDALTTKLKTLQAEEDRVDARMESVRTRYEKQFAALDTLMARLNSTSAYLASALKRSSASD